MLHAASLFHASGCFLLPYWVKGAATAVLAKFEPAEFLNAIARWRVTSTHMVPTMLAMLLDQPNIENADMTLVRTIVYGASPMPAPVIKRALELWGYLPYSRLAALASYDVPGLGAVESRDVMRTTVWTVRS